MGQWSVGLYEGFVVIAFPIWLCRQPEFEISCWPRVVDGYPGFEFHMHMGCRAVSRVPGQPQQIAFLYAIIWFYKHLGQMAIAGLEAIATTGWGRYQDKVA